MPTDNRRHTPDSVIIFLDVEASSLGIRGYPIEVGWAIVGDDQILSVENHLIQPTRAWLESWEWNDASAKIHKITLPELKQNGKTIDAVCRRLVDQLAGAVVHTDNPTCDGRWLGALFAAWQGHNLIVPMSALPMRIHDAALLLGPPAISQEAWLHAEERFANVPIPHRAGADAFRLSMQYITARRHDRERQVK